MFYWVKIQSSINSFYRLLEELGHRSDCNGVQAMKFLQGLVLAINCLAETPMFLYSGKFVIAWNTIWKSLNIVFIFQPRSLKSLAASKSWTAFCSSFLWDWCFTDNWFLPGKWSSLNGSMDPLLDSFTQSWLQLHSKFLRTIWPQQQQLWLISWKV